MANDLEQSLLDSIWRRHEHCGDCGCRREEFIPEDDLVETFCTATEGADCPWFQEELNAWIEETFDPGEWEFLNRYNSMDAEGLFLAFYRAEFKYFDFIAESMLNLYHQAKALKEQS